MFKKKNKNLVWDLVFKTKNYTCQCKLTFDKNIDRDVMDKFVNSLILNCHTLNKKQGKDV